MMNFIESYNLRNLIRMPSCFKNPENLSCIDLLLTNSPYSFQSMHVTETDLSYFHKMTVAVMKVSFHKIKYKYLNYRRYNLLSVFIIIMPLTRKLCDATMNMELSKAIMTKTRLGTQFLKNRTDGNQRLYMQQ